MSRPVVWGGVFAVLAMGGSSSASAADAAWAIADAPFRAVMNVRAEGNFPDVGVAIEVPEIGQTMAGLADVILTDAKGAPIPIMRLWRGEGQNAVVIAQGLKPGQEAELYFGGNRARRAPSWTPKQGLFLETRQLDATVDPELKTWSEVEGLWKKAGSADGGGMVPMISSPLNPFGESERFMSHYSGWLKTDGKKTTLYTLSSDASFVLVGDRYEFGWPGKHSPRIPAKDVPRKEVSTSGGAIKIDYYQAKVSDGAPVMLLGWFKDDKPEAIPASAWVHPGRAELLRFEHVQGWPVPSVQVQKRGYLGWEGLWLYETHCSLSSPLPEGWSASWEFSDGSKKTGPACDRALIGNAPVRVVVRLKRGNDEVVALQKIDFVANPEEQLTSDPAVVNRYVALLEGEDPSTLSEASLKAGFQFLNEFGSDQAIGKYATSWLAKKPSVDDPLWVRGQLARLRVLAQSDPKRALAELRKFDSSIRNKYSKELGMEELELLVFYLKDPGATAVAQQIGFQNANNDVSRLAKIRLGDLARLLGKDQEAKAQYLAAQKTVTDDTQGRKFAAEDRANSIAVTDLIAQGDRHAAEAKLLDWELGHPLTKFDSDFLLLRGRVLMEFGRWNEALQEFESFRQMNPDNPYQIPADFYRARALYELGKRDEARAIWQSIATKYPKHDLAKESAEWAAKK